MVLVSQASCGQMGYCCWLWLVDVIGYGLLGPISDDDLLTSNMYSINMLLLLI